LCLDSNDNPHISYYLNYWLRYAGWNGINWHNERVDSIRNNAPANISYTSIAVDKDGYAHISCRREFITDKSILRYATGPGITGISEELETKLSKTMLEVSPTIAVNELKITYSLEKGSDVNVNVYNILGQRIAKLVSEEKVAGEHVSYWSVKDDKGKVARNGIYFCTLRAGGFTATRKIAVVR